MLVGICQTGDKERRLRCGDLDDAALFVSSLTCLSRLLNVELICDVEEVWVDKTECLGGKHFSARLGVEHKLDPALSSLGLDVVLDRSAYLAFAQECSVDKPVQK